MDFARGSVVIGVEPREGFGAEQAWWPEDGGKRDVLVECNGTADLVRPFDGTVVGGVEFLGFRGRGKSWVEAERGRVFGEVRGCNGASSGPSWSSDLLWRAGREDGAKVSRAWIDAMS